MPMPIVPCYARELAIVDGVPAMEALLLPCEAAPPFAAAAAAAADRLARCVGNREGFRDPRPIGVSDGDRLLVADDSADEKGGVRKDRCGGKASVGTGLPCAEVT